MKRTRLVMAGLCVAAGLALPAAAALAETVTLHANMDGPSEVPPTKSTGTGAVDATLDTATDHLHYTVTYSGLTGDATAAHFHGPAALGTNAGVAVAIKPALPSPLTGDVTLTPDQAKDLLAGKYYVNVHTAANPGGEIRGQVTVVK